MTSMLTPELFAEGAKALAAACANAEFTEPWVWVEHPGPLSTAMGGGYLSCTTTTPSTTPNEYLTRECHAIYSLSYRVPVMYFRGHQQDGSMLDPSHLLAPTPQPPSSQTDHAMYTQEDHPFKKQPYYMLHQCQTGAVLKLLLAEEDGNNADQSRGRNADDGARRGLQYVAAWLCVAGQPLGLGLSPEQYAGLLASGDV